MTATEVLTELQRRGVTLRVDEQGRIIAKPIDAVDEALRAEVRANKEEILRLLASAVPSRPSVPFACPRCGGGFDAAPAERGGGCLRLVCVACEYFAIAYPRGAADALCLRCNTRLTRRDAGGGWERLACQHCGWLTFERPESVPARPRGDAAGLKTLWRDAWTACKTALTRGDRVAAEKFFDEWHAADRRLREVLGAEGYAGFVEQQHGDGRWLP
jgi:hypothetical protein